MLRRVLFWVLTKLGKKTVRLMEGSETRGKIVSLAFSMKLMAKGTECSCIEQLEVGNLYPTARLMDNVWILNVFQRPECNIDNNVPSKSSRLQSPLEDTRKMCYQPVLVELGAQRSFPL